MTTASSITDLIARLQRGSKTYNGGTPGPTTSKPAGVAGGLAQSPGYTPTKNLAFEPELAGQERGINRNLQELIAFTNRNRGRTRQDYTLGMGDSALREGRDTRDTQSSFAGRNLLSSTPGQMTLQRLAEDYGIERRDLGIQQERGLADIEAQYVTGTGRHTDELAEVTRQRAAITQQRELERAQQEARNRALTEQFVNKVPLEGLNEKWLNISDPGTVMKMLQRQMGRKF